MLLPRLDGELRDRDVEELDRAVAATNSHLVLVRFRPGCIEEGVLCVITVHVVSMSYRSAMPSGMGAGYWNGCSLRLLGDNAIRREI